MDKNYLIDKYLKGKHPIEQDKWDLPTESELDRDEALFNALLAERPSKSPLKGDFTSPLRGGRVGSWRGWRRLWGSVAAVLIAAVALFTWRSFMLQQPTRLAEKTEEPVKLEDAPRDTAKRGTTNCPTRHVMMANEARLIDQLSEPRSKTSQPKGIIHKEVKEGNPTAEQPLLAEAKPQQEEDVPAIPADKQALVNIFLAEEALQVAYELRAQQEAIRAYAASLTGRELPKPIIAF